MIAAPCCGKSCPVGSDTEYCVYAIGFDFDDTLFVSERTKADIAARIMKKCFGVKRGVPAAWKKMIGSGLTTGDKMGRLVRKFLHKRATDKQKRMLNKMYTYHYVKEMMKCPLMQCSNIVKELKKQVKVMFIITLNRPKDIIPSLKHCGLYDFFDEILGLPRTKVQNLKYVSRKYKIEPYNIVFVGDQKGDVRSAKKAGVHFVGITRSKARQKFMHRLGAHFTFSNLCELPPQLLLEEPRYEEILKKQWKLEK